MNLTLNNTFFSNKTIQKFLLLLFSSCLFGISNSFTGWFVFVPVLFLVKNANFKFVWLWGGLYGTLSYLFYAFWLFNYSKISIVFVCFVFFIYWAILFIILKTALVFGRKIKPFLITAILVIYEFLKTCGFLGISYGVNAYTQYKNLFFIQTSDFGGVWFVTAVLNLSSVAIFCFLEKLFDSELVKAYNFSEKKQIFCDSLLWFVKTPVFFVVTSSIIFSYIYGFFKIRSIDEKTKESSKICAASIQHNTDPWKGSFDFYKNDVENLISLSKQAISENPELKLIVWPETAVVPSILKHYYVTENTPRKQLITSLLDFIDSQSCAFLIGNFNPDGENNYNSAMLFEGGKNVIPPEPVVYSKIHLVPFGEYFPYKKQFPRLYEALLKFDVHFWEQGTQRTVFTYNDLKFSVPICFEDSFGSDCKKFVNAGARAFLNLSNDAWSKSHRSQEQHLQMAVFRSVENHIPTLRSTASGVTCYIDPCGRVERIPEFSKGYICSQIPIFY